MRILVSAAAGAAVLLLAVGCATTPGDGAGAGSGPGGGVPSPPAAPDEVLAQGTVLQVGDAPPELCFGAIAESFPPQCAGPQVDDWSWDAAGGQEEAAGTTWGAYAVLGTWDGERFAVTGSPIHLALYDPAPVPPDPRRDPAEPGPGSDDELLTLQRELTSLEGLEVLESAPDNGRLFVKVAYDDGTLQEWADETYGADFVAIESAMRDMPRPD